MIQSAWEILTKRKSRWYHGLSATTGKIRFAVCHTCMQRHQLVPPNLDQGFADYAQRHLGHALDWVDIWKPDHYLELLALAPNADVKQALQSAQTMTVTNLHSKASSATAGWQSDVVDNTSNLYLDDLWQIVIDFANTAPANSKACFVYAYHGLETTYTNPYTGSEGNLTLLDVTTTAQAAPLLGVLPYTTADEVAESATWSMARTSDGVLPPKYGVGIINYSGAALAASGNTVKHRGVYATVI